MQSKLDLKLDLKNTDLYQKIRQSIMMILSLTGTILAQANLLPEVKGGDDFKFYDQWIEQTLLANENQWDSLIIKYKDSKQVQFWQKIFKATDDFYYLNSRKDRVIYDSLDNDTFSELKSNKADFKNFKKVKAKNFGLNEDDLYFTPGYNSHYDFEAVQSEIEQAYEIFKDLGVNPIYAEMILLIESPKGHESNLGATGNFQLMPDVARKYGLTVNEEVDERKIFEKAAACAAKFLKDQEQIIERTLEYLDLTAKDEAYFSLLVLNSYQTGEKNMYAILKLIKEKYGFSEFNHEFLEKLWVERFGGEYEYPLAIINNSFGDKTLTLEGTYGNQSSNYTQVAISALIQNRLNKFEELMPTLKIDSLPIIEIKESRHLEKQNGIPKDNNQDYRPDNHSAFISDETRRILRYLNRNYARKKKNFRG